MGIKYAGTVPRRVRRARCPAEPSRLTRRVRPASGSPGGRPQPVRMVGRGVPPSRRTCGDCPRGAKTLKPSNLQTLALSPCLGRVEMLRFIWNCLRPFGFIVVEGDPRPMTQKSRPGQGSRNSERKAKGDHVTRKCDREDFRLQKSDVN